MNCMPCPHPWCPGCLPHLTKGCTMCHCLVAGLAGLGGTARRLDSAVGGSGVRWRQVGVG